MALITFAGFPAAGKSTRAAQLRDFLLERIRCPEYSGPIQKVLILSDHSLGLSRNVYDDSTSEKPARGSIFTNLQRQLAIDTILILDSLNYIKGFRYQMYCAAREMKLRTCTVHVVASPDLCREWNSQRPNDEAYTEATLENLLVRFEEPSSMVRWDAPLFTVVWTDEAIPGEPIWQAITKGNLKPPNSGTLSAAKAPTDALHILEQTTAAMVSAIVSASSSQPTGGATIIPIGSARLSITLPQRIITVPEMQRVKRQFVTIHKKAITLGTIERGAVDFDEEGVADKFADYIAEHLFVHPSTMPLPVNSTLSVLGASRPGDALLSKPKKAMLVRMSSETLDALEASIAQPQLQFDFGESPGICVGEAFFPMIYLQENSLSEVYLRAASATKKNAPLKLFANVVGKLTIEQREIGSDLRDKIRESTQDAVAHKNSRATVFMDNPPETQTVTKKRKEVSMFHKPLRPSDKPKPVPPTPTSTPPSKATTSGQSHGVPVRKRLVHCLARGEKQEEELFKLLGAADRSSYLHTVVVELLDNLADLKPSSDKSQRVYQLKPIAWKEVRPYEWPGLSSQERTQMARMGRFTLKGLRIPESDPLWMHFQYQPSGAAPVPSSSTLSDPRTTSNATVDDKVSAAHKRGVSSREIKEKKVKPKKDAKAEIHVKDESQRAATTHPPGDESRRPSAGEASTSAAARRHPPSARSTKPPVNDSPSQTASSRLSTTTHSDKAFPQDVKRARDSDILPESSKDRVKTKERLPPKDRRDDSTAEKSKSKKRPVEDEIDRVIRKAVEDDDYLESKISAKRKAKEEADYLESRNPKRRMVEDDVLADSRGKTFKQKARDDDDYVNTKTNTTAKRKAADAEGDYFVSKPGSFKRKADADDDYTGAKSGTAKRKATEADDDYEPARQKRHKPGRDSISSNYSRDERQKGSALPKRPVVDSHLDDKATSRDRVNQPSSSKNRQPLASPSPPAKRDTPLNERETEQRRSSTLSSSKPTKVRRKSPVYTSTEDEKEDTPLSRDIPTKSPTTPPLNAVTATKIQPTRNINFSQPLPSDNASLRARYNTKYLEYLNVMQRLLVQKGRLDSLLKSSDLESSGSITDSEGEVELLSPEDLETLAASHKRLRNELQAIQQAFNRGVPVKGEPMSD